MDLHEWVTCYQDIMLNELIAPSHPCDTCVCYLCCIDKPDRIAACDLIKESHGQGEKGGRGRGFGEGDDIN